MIVKTEGRHLTLTDAARFRGRLLQIPGFNKWKDSDTFLFEPTRANIEWIEQEFPAAEWHCSHLKDLDSLRATEQSSLQLHREKPSADDYEFKTEPFQHQVDAFMRSRDLEWFGYLMEMGTGKTKVLIDNAAYLWHNSKIDGLVVIAPNGVHRQFVREQIPTHMPDDVDIECLVYQSGGKKYEKQAKIDFCKPTKTFRILAINVESLSHQSGVDYVITFLKSFGGVGQVRPVLIAVDESTRIKNATSNRSVNVCKLGTYCKYRRILTGSPITKGVEDLFGQLKFLSPKILGFSSFYTFRNHYCIVDKRETKAGDDYAAIVGYQNIPELQQKMAPWVHRVKKEDCLDLPPKIYMTREVPLSEQQKVMYNQLRKEMLLEFEGNTLTATMAAVRLTKLQQIICGHVRFTAEAKTVIISDVPRIQAVKDILDQVEGQVLIWCRFIPDIDRLNHELRDYGVSRYDGSVSKDERLESIDSFRAARNRIFLANPAVGGIGLNLVGPPTVIYYSNSFDAEHRWQSEDRNHRAGTVNTVTYIDLISPNTIDSYILANLSRKKDIASLTIDEMKTFLKEEV